MITPAKVLRFWRTSRPLRQRFGLRDGLRLANAIADVTHRRSDVAFLPVHVPGWSDPIWLRPRTSDVDVFFQLVVGSELDLDFDPPPRRILDGGANIGLASRIFAHRWPGAEIVAVELEARNYEALKRNCESTPQVHTRWAALWNERVNVGVDPAGDDQLGFRVDREGVGPQVAAMPLEDVLDEMGWDTVDLVKLDIEGAEREVLETASRWLPRVNHLVVELHDRYMPGCTAAFEAMIDRKIWKVSGHGEYVVASRIAAD